MEDRLGVAGWKEGWRGRKVDERLSLGSLRDKEPFCMVTVSWRSWHCGRVL
jgi:hypothetical protein